MRLIDADELRKEIDKQAYPHRDSTANDIYFSVLHLLADAPTVDAVPVVRCGWCSWFRKGYCVHPVQDMIPVMAGHFCGYGECKDGD